jgi:predicted transcriptional regulator
MDRNLPLVVLFSVAAMTLAWSPVSAEEPVPQIEISATPQEITIYVGMDPGDRFDININNTGNESVMLKLAGAQVPVNWTLRFLQNGTQIDSIEVGPRASVNFTAEVAASYRALAGPYTLYANFSDDHGHSWELPLIVHVRQIYDFDIWADLVEKPGLPGRTVEFKFFIKNRGNGVDRIELTNSRLPAGFSLSFVHNGTEVREIDLPLFPQGNVTARVAIPPAYAGGDIEILITGTSKCSLTDQHRIVIRSNQFPANADLSIGPFKDEAGDPVGGALVALSNAGGRWSNLTGSAGTANITAHASCLDTDVVINATHPQYEDLEFRGTVGLSDFKPDGGIYPVFIKRPRIVVGPFIGNDGKPMENASLQLSDGVRTFSGATDRAGMAGIYIPKGMLGKPVHLTIGCMGYVDGIVDGNVSAEGKFEPAGGSYPVLEKTVRPRPTAAGAAPAATPALWIGLGSGLLIIAGLIGGTEVGKVGFFSFIMPLYSRVNKDKVLDNFSRGMIYGHVVEHPGINFTELKGLSNIANGTLTYHLKVLEGEGMIVAHNRGIHRIFFPSSIQASTRDLALNKSEQMVLSMIRASPGISQAGLAGDADLSEATIHRIIASLELKGLVSVEKGVRNRCFVRTAPAGSEAPVAVPPVFPAER